MQVSKAGPERCAPQARKPATCPAGACGQQTGQPWAQVGEGNLERRALRAEKLAMREMLYPVLQAEEDRRRVAGGGLVRCSGLCGLRHGVWHVVDNACFSWCDRRAMCSSALRAGYAGGMLHVMLPGLRLLRARLAGQLIMRAACRWVKEKERCLENEAKIMKDVRPPLSHTVLCAHELFPMMHTWGGLYHVAFGLCSLARMRMSRRGRRRRRCPVGRWARAYTLESTGCRLRSQSACTAKFCKAGDAAFGCAGSDTHSGGKL